MVPATASSPRRSRTPAAISSRPVASGNFLGSVGLVALAPAQVRLSLDLVLELDDPVHQRLGPRRAARHIDVDRQELVGARDQRVVVEHPGARRARAHRDHPLRLEHLVVDAADDRRHLDRDAARQDDHVRLARGGPEHLGPEARRVHPRRADDRDHLDRAAGQPERERPRRVSPRPVLRLFERGQADALLEVGLEVVGLELAAEHLPGPELPDPEVARIAVTADAVARHLHSSAPLLHTNAKATNRSTMKTIVSTSAKVPNALRPTATGYRKTTSISKRMNSIAIR